MINFKISAAIGAFYGFFVFGLIDNIKGAVLPNFLKHFKLNYSQGSDFLIFIFIGYMTGTLAAGFIAGRVSKNRVVTVSAVFMIAGVTSLTLLKNFLLVRSSLFIFGIGLGLIQVAGNGIIVDSYQQNKGKYLNLLAFFHGVGSIIAPLFAAFLLSITASWQAVYQLSLIFPIILLIVTIFVRDTPDKKVRYKNKETTSVLRTKEKINIELVLMAIIICCYIAAEIGVASWMVEYLNQEKLFTNSQSSLYLSLFFGFLTIGRLFGSFIVERIGYLKILLYAIAFVIFLLLTGIFLPPFFAVLIPASGLCFSIIFPTTIALASNRFQEKTDRILSWLFFSGGIGGTIGPWLIGKVSHITNLTIGLTMVVLYCSIILIALMLLSMKSLMNDGNLNKLQLSE